jgi:hypothetical protein
MMLLPSWFIINEDNTEEGIYKWDTAEMQSVYRILDMAKENDMTVNVTMWGIDTGTAGFMRIPNDPQWVTYPDAKYEQLLVDCFADSIKYLIEEKKYDNIKEITLFNEPNSLYGFGLGGMNGGKWKLYPYSISQIYQPLPISSTTAFFPSVSISVTSNFTYWTCLL